MMFRRTDRMVSILIVLVLLLNWSEVLSQAEVVSFTLFRDADSLTLYIPGNQLVSLRGLRLESETASGIRIGRALEDYPSFRGLDFGTVRAPICFRIEREGSGRALPLDCQTTTTLKQAVPDGDVFWYDATGNSQRLVLLLGVGSSEALGFCPVGETRCDLSYLPPTPTPTLTATLTLTATATLPPTATLTPSLTPSHTPRPTLRPTATIPPTPAGTPVGGGRGQIAFVSNGDIYIADIDGNNLRRLTDGIKADYSVAWSPDGMQIVFDAERDGNIEIFVMDADGSNLRQLTDHPAWDAYPAWSPDGQRIAFSSDRDGDGETYVMNVDGSNVRRLTDDPTSTSTNPMWSPDGQRIAFDSFSNDGNRDIKVMNADGSNVVRLTNELRNSFEPAWSPDGQHIAFWYTQSGFPDDADIYVMNSDGSNVRNLDQPGNGFHPVWSPDGMQIAFVSEQPSNVDIYVMNADGSNVRRLNLDFVPYKIAWRP